MVEINRSLRCALGLALASLAGCSMSPAPLATAKQPTIRSICAGKFPPNDTPVPGRTYKIQLLVSLTTMQRLDIIDGVTVNGASRVMSVQNSPSCRGRVLELFEENGQIRYHLEFAGIAEDGKPRVFTWDDKFPVAAGKATGTRDGLPYSITIIGID